MLVDDPLDFGKVLAGRKFRIVLTDCLKVLRFLHQVAEIVHGFANLITTIAVVRRDFGHGKISLGKYHTFGVDADKDFRNLGNIKLMGQLDYTNAVVLNLLQFGKYIIDCAALAVIQLVFDAVVNNKVKRIKAWLIKRCNVRNPCPIFFDSRIGHFKTLFQWMEGNFDTFFAVVAADYRLPNNRCL